MAQAALFHFLILLFLSLVLFCASFIHAQNPLAVPPNDSCLYLSNTNGRVLVLTTEENYSLVNSRILSNGSIIAAFSDGGLLPSGIAVYDDVTYISSYQVINAYNVSYNMEKMNKTFVDFEVLYAQFGYTCLPASIVALDGVLYVSCNPGIPFTILKFSLDPEDYGTFLNGTVTDLTSFSFTKLEIHSGNFLFQGQTNYEPYGAYLFAIAFPTTIYAMRLSNVTKYDAIGSAGYWRFSYSGAAPGATLAATAAVTGSEQWSGMTFGADGNFYGIRRFLPANFNASAITAGKDGFFGDILKFNGTTGAYISTVTGKSTGKLAKAVAITLGPLGLFYVSIVSQFYYNAKVAIYDPTTGKRLDNYIYGSTDNELVPQGMQWYPCLNFTTNSLASEPVLLETPTDSTDDTKTIVVATIIPAVAVWVCCMLVVLLLVLLLIAAKIAWSRRRRTYDVEDEDQELAQFGDQTFTYREIDPVDLTFGPFLGEGAFGKVYKGTWREAVVAIKTFDVSLDDADEDMLMEIRREAQMMSKLGNHPNVIGFIGAVTSPGNGAKLCIVAEFCPKGSLYDFLIKKKRRVPLVAFIKMARDIASGILHLHKEKIIHRDIATRNVLVGENYNVFISDFGMARILEGGNDAQQTAATMGPVRWMAPECMLKREYSEASDAFAYGVTLWEMVTRKAPWRGMQTPQVIIAVTQKNMRLQVPLDCDPILARIIKGTWKTSPAKRMKMPEIIEKLEKYHDSLKQVYEFSDSETEGDEKTGLVSKGASKDSQSFEPSKDSFGSNDNYGHMEGNKIRSEEDLEMGLAPAPATAVKFKPREDDEDEDSSMLLSSSSDDEDSDSEDQSDSDDQGKGKERRK